MSFPAVSRILACLLCHAGSLAPAQTENPAPAGMVHLPGGQYQPLYAKAATPRTVRGFFMSTAAVTNGQFLEFVRRNPQWQRSRVTRENADENYLRHWAGDLDLGPEAARLQAAPVTGVSWFAARAYCEAQGTRLPVQDEWEFAARADATRIDASTDQAFLKKLLEWYSKPNAAVLPAAGEAEANVYGLRGLHGQVWEWVHDFNSTMIIGDARGDDSLERKLFCGAGALQAGDVSNYAAFMRYAFRSSLKGNYCVGSLGFRMAQWLPGDVSPAGAPVAANPYALTSRWRTGAGRETGLDTLAGKVRLVTMGFTSCRYSCSRIVSDIHRIEEALGPDADRIGIVFASIDPEGDTPAAMSAFATDRKLSPDRWTFLTGDQAGIRDLAVALDFKYQQVDKEFSHSNLIAVLDAKGNVVHRVESLGADIGPTVEAVKRLLASPR